MKGGAVDVLTKPVNKEELLEAVERAVAIARRDRRERARIKEIRDRIKTLTPREAKVFALVVTGMLNKQSAAELGVVEKTVKMHRAHVMSIVYAIEGEGGARGTLVDAFGAYSDPTVSSFLQGVTFGEAGPSARELPRFGRYSYGFPPPDPPDPWHDEGGESGSVA